MGSESKKNNKTMLYVGIGGGVLLLGCCCLGLSGTGAWFLFLRGGPEKKLVGKWSVDWDATKSNSPLFKDLLKGVPPDKMPQVEQQARDKMASMVIEFKSDGTMSYSDPTKKESGKWKTVETKGDVLTIETKADGSTKDWEKFDVKFVDSDRMTFTPLKKVDFQMWMKRV
jgi:hypothetical protein